MAGRRVWLVGCGGELIGKAEDGWGRLPVQRLRNAFKPCSEGAVVVLGSGVVRAVDPKLVKVLACAPYVRLLVVASRDAQRGPWKRAEWAELVAPNELCARIDALCDLPVRSVLPLRLWAPRVLRKDPSLVPSLRTLARSRTPAFVASWMGALGRNRHFVTHRLSRSKWTAKTLCLRYGRAYHAHETARGIPEGWIAAHLGYSRVSVMKAALGVTRDPDQESVPSDE